MPLDIYTPHDLYAVMHDERLTVPTNHWLTRYYPNSFFSTQEEILFDSIGGTRKIAPFMLPNVAGRPIFKREGERINSFRPAYTKPKDAVRPSEMLALQPGELVRRQGLMSPAARYDAEVTRITQYHRNAIHRLWDWMAAKALIDGAITIAYNVDAGVPAQLVTIDFGRAGNQTIVKGSSEEWGDSGISVFDDIQLWADRMALAEFGGAASDLVLGAGAATLFLNDASITARLDTTVRGSEDVLIKRGLIRTDPLNPFTWIGKLGSLDVWRYVATYQNNDGSYTPVLGAYEALMVAPNVDGVKCFGAILDTAANIEVADIFVKMWDQEDPSARFIMSQSAPLMIPTNPNCTLKATVKVV